MVAELPALGGPRGTDLLTANAIAGSRPQVNGAAAEERDVGKVATDFTSILVQNLVREMFETVKEGEGPFGSGPGSDIQRSVAETAFSQSLAARGLDSLRDAIQRAITPRESMTTFEAAAAAVAEGKNLRTEESK